jgi:hypothetical protein
MTRMAEAGITTLVWSEDEKGNIFAEGLAEYEIDTNNELAVFHAEKCVKIHEAVDLCHAAALVYAHEAVLRWNIRNGKTGRGYPVNERGWQIKR